MQNSIFLKKALLAVIVSAVLLLIPLFYLLKMVSQNFSEQINNISSERVGLTYINQMTPMLLTDWSEYAKINSLSEEQNKEELELQKHKASLLIFKLSNEKSFSIKFKSDELVLNTSMINSLSQFETYYGQLLDTVANNSKLVLDTELETYYLMLIVTEDYLKYILEMRQVNRRHINQRHLSHGQLNNDHLNQDQLTKKYIQNGQSDLSSKNSIKISLLAKLKTSFEAFQTTSAASDLKFVEKYQKLITELSQPNVDQFRIAKTEENVYYEIQSLLEDLLRHRQNQLEDKFLKVLRSTFALVIVALILVSLIFTFVWQRHFNMQNTISSQEKSLEIAAKLSTLGELAGSLGHEIATPLTVISNSASKVKKHIGAMSLETPQRTDINKHFEKIERMVGRVEQIIKSIKNQVHSSDKELPVPVSVKEVISEVIVLTQSKAVKHGVEILVEPIDEKLQVMATEPELVQVLTNLVSNGIDAIRDSNKIRSNSDLLAVEVKSWIKIHAKENSDNLNELSIIVADSGSGVPAELQAKIFDSLFTTKKSGEGTGLGLSISKRLVKKHGGTLSLLPNNPGAQFEVRLKKAA